MFLTYHLEVYIYTSIYYILSDILSGIYFDILSVSLSGIYSNILFGIYSEFFLVFNMASIKTFYLANFQAFIWIILAFFLAYSDILSDILSGTLCGTLCRG